MRATARDFMTETLFLYNVNIAYDEFGRQVTTSGLLATVSGYFGGLSGSDQELLSNSILGITQRNGVRVKTSALALMPFETTITNQNIIRKAGEDWHVVWNNNDTQDSVQVYTKAIVVQFETIDEKRHG